MTSVLLCKTQSAERRSKFYYRERSDYNLFAIFAGLFARLAEALTKQAILAKSNMKPIGKVIHYYDKISVAIVALSDKMKVGDKIKIEGGKNEFDQTVDSMEIDRKPVDSAGPGNAVGIKVKEKTGEGALVLKIEE